MFLNHKLVLVILLSIIIKPNLSEAQTWLDTSKKWHNKTRPGIGVMFGGVPNALVLQLYKGGYCGDKKRLKAYAKDHVLNIYVGSEGNETPNSYESGTIKSGAIRYGLEYHYPFYTFISPNIQLYIGLGIQAGDRNYVTTVENNEFTTGLTLPAGLEYNLHYFNIGQSGILMISGFFEYRLFKEFGHDYDYIKPSFGVRLTKFK